MFRRTVSFIIRSFRCLLYSQLCTKLCKRVQLLKFSGSQISTIISFIILQLVNCYKSRTIFSVNCIDALRNVKRPNYCKGTSKEVAFTAEQHFINTCKCNNYNSR